MAALKGEYPKAARLFRRCEESGPTSKAQAALTEDSTVMGQVLNWPAATIPERMNQKWAATTSERDQAAKVTVPAVAALDLSALNLSAHRR